MRISERIRSLSFLGESPRGSLLQLHEVLEEEYESLHPEVLTPEHRQRHPDDAPPAGDAGVLPEHLVDPGGLARDLAGPEPVARWLAGELRSTTRVLLRRYRAAGEAERQEAEGRIREALAAELTRLLDRELESEPCLREAASRPLTRNLLRVRPAEARGVDPRQLRRLLLEDALPRHLARLADLRLAAVHRRIHRRQHAALCLSGGGIRSATFALGVVQGLARHGLLDKFHYLSTVSGGGYLGGWLSAWMAHTSAERVVEALRAPPSSRLEPEAAPIRHLRSYSNYLSPRLGLFSADTWTLASTYLRNLLLGWMVLVPLLTALTLLPRLLVAVVGYPPWAWGAPAAGLVSLLFGAGFVLAVASESYVHRNRPGAVPLPEAGAGRGPGDQGDFLWRCLLPLVGAALALTTGWGWMVNWGLAPESHWRGAAAFAGVGGLLHLAGWLPAPGEKRRAEAAAIAASGLVAGALTYGAALLISAVSAHATRAWELGTRDEWYVVLALPLFLLILLFGNQLFLGLSSRWRAEDPEREWAARYDAWVLIVIVGWLGVGALVLFGPTLVGRALGAFAGAGLLSGAATALLGGSSGTPGSPREEAEADRRGWRAWLGGAALGTAAAVFATVLVVLLSVLGRELLRLATGPLWPSAPGGAAPPGVVLLVGSALVGMGLLMGWLIDTNKFSLHAMYRMRLIRAYLGASRPAGERRPDPFTGFDEADNLHMHRLWPAAPVPAGQGHPPLHLVNATLNLVRGQNLAWQERKAESFTFSALHAGSPFAGYRRTSPAPHHPGGAAGSGRLYGGRQGITLGTAMTISGAAANPNMGYHSSAVVTFLMTLFNARLGWWLGNPGPAGADTHHRSSPRLSLRPILAEMFGLTDDRSAYVHLSDGGHFENLGLYEMVLRRCRFIVVSDAGCDPDCALQDLGNAIRRIRVDLGVPIEFDAGFPIYGRGQGRTDGRSWALGRIRYSCVDAAPGEPAEDYDGTLVYLKPTFYGAEPRDVYNYAISHPDFPHESTLDQFFSESQFESYRSLGSHIIDQICREPGMTAMAPSPEAPQPASLPWFEFRIRSYGRSEARDPAVDGPR